MDNDKDIGELSGILKTFMEEARSHRGVTTEKMEHIHECMEERFAALNVRLGAIEKELSIYQTIYKTIKAILLVAAAIVTLKFGDVRTIWNKVFI